MAGQSYTNDQVAEVSGEWAQTFYGRIPEDRLHECFEVAAYKPRERGFMINAYEIITAWNGIAADLAAKQKQAPCIQWDNHVGNPNDREFKIVHPDGMRDVVLPCVHCSPEAFNAAYSVLRAKTPNPCTEGVFRVVKAACDGEFYSWEIKDILHKITS